MKWINVESDMPPEEEKINTLWFDVWTKDGREVDAKFKGGCFYRQVEDYQGDYSHDEKIIGVTHWLKVEGPDT